MGMVRGEEAQPERPARSTGTANTTISATAIAAGSHGPPRPIASTTAPTARTPTTPTAIRQSSPTTKSYQNRPNATRKRTVAASGRGRLDGLGDTPAEREHERPRHREPGDEHDDDRQLAAWPLEALAARREDAQALDRPERPERRQQDPDAVLD